LFANAARKHAMPEVENLAENESDEQNQHNKLQVSPQIVAWKEKGSFHYQMIDRKRS
jgi:predicted double-glycine peptidase